MKIILLVFLLLFIPFSAKSETWTPLASTSIQTTENKGFIFIDNINKQIDQKIIYNIEDYNFISDTSIFLRHKLATTTSTSSGYYVANIIGDNIFLHKNTNGVFSLILKEKVKSNINGTTTPVSVEFSATGTNPTILNFKILNQYQVLENHNATDTTEILQATTSSGILILKSATSTLKLSTTTYNFFTVQASTTIATTTIKLATTTPLVSTSTPTLFSIKKSHTLQKLEDNLEKIEKEIEKEKKRREQLEKDFITQ